ncbi:helix-turn-helix domain-containing protein [Roseomonas sp. F4]
MNPPPVLPTATATGSDPACIAPPRPTYRGGEMLRQAHRRWNAIGASLSELRCGPALQISLWAEGTQLSVILEEIGGRTSICVSPRNSMPAPLGKPLPMSFIPPRLRARAETRGLRYLRHLVLQFDGGALAETRDKAVDLQGFLADWPMFFCPRLLCLAKAFADECESPEPESQLHGDGLAAELLDSLAQLAGSAGPSEAQGLLAPWQLRRAVEILRERLDENVRMHELAAETRLSVSYFCRAFKASTGMPPHRWQLQARIERVKELLLDDRDSMAEIAVMAGFADQAHMTRTFSRMAGMSPGAWQRPRRVALKAA